MKESLSGLGHLVRLTANDRSRFFDLCALYREAIPANERKPEGELQSLLSRKEYRVFLWEEDRRILGFAILYRSTENPCALLEYMAVDRRFRGAGIGSRILAELWSPEVLGRETDICLVEVDAPGERHADSEIRRRRQDFYRRNGCYLIQDLSYILPLPFQGDPPDMQLMSFLRDKAVPVPRDTLRVWLRDIYVHVYGCRSDDPRIIQMMERLPGDPVFV